MPPLNVPPAMKQKVEIPPRKNSKGNSKKELVLFPDFKRKTKTSLKSPPGPPEVIMKYLRDLND